MIYDLLKHLEPKDCPKIMHPQTPETAATSIQPSNRPTIQTTKQPTHKKKNKSKQTTNNTQQTATEWPPCLRFLI